MFYYTYDINGYVLSKSNIQPIDTKYGIHAIDFDLDNYDIIIGSIDENYNITFYTQNPKPTAILIQNLTILKSNLLDSDNIMLDLDYRLTLQENGLKESDIT